MRRGSMRARFCVLASAFAIAGCGGRYSEVSHVHPHLPTPPGTGALAVVERTIAKAMQEERAHPKLALGDCLLGLQAATRELERDSNDSIALRDYDFGIARIFQIVHDARLDPWTSPLTVPSSSGGDFTLTYKPDPRPEWNPALYDFTPADEYDVHGEYVNERTTRPGVGAAIVAVEREPNKRARPDFAPSRIYYSVSVVARFTGNRCELEFLDPLADETVDFNGRIVPLAADFTVPLAVMLEETDPKKHEWARLVNPEKFAHTAAIERLQPFDPNKTVVLVIHGLMDSQATWTPMINTLRGDPVIRQNYQFWFYSYPSGYPYPYIATILREELNRVEHRFPEMKPMVVIGHSMGGCIARLLITDSGDELWLKIFGRPPNEVTLSQKAREYFQEELFFHHREEIGRVIFIAAPLRGSELASGWLYKLLSRLLITDPGITGTASDEMLRATAHIREEELKPKRRANSVDSLSPKSRFVHAINTIPMTPGVPYDTIIGDQGRGDSPNSSDGVVPYWSSHMDGAESEQIVPSDHKAHQNPQAIAEVLRVLKEHAQ
jgi:pimeloyl-ACP methyl ester carboxylesterase